jgi:hypothetical protein
VASGPTARTYFGVGSGAPAVDDGSGEWQVDHRREPGGRQFTSAQSITITEILGFLLRRSSSRSLMNDVSPTGWSRQRAQRGRQPSVGGDTVDLQPVLGVGSEAHQARDVKWTLRPNVLVAHTRDDLGVGCRRERDDDLVGADGDPHVAV